MALTGAHRTGSVESPLVLYDDAPDDDPNRDAKDAAFAQAYLEKVRNIFRCVQILMFVYIS